MGYYIAQNNESKGPFTLSQLKGMWASGSITGNLQYCEEGSQEWMPLSVLQPLLEPEQTQYSTQTQQFLQRQAVKVAKNRGIFIILGLFFGCLGIHNFYAGRYRLGAWQLIVTILLGWLVVGIVITGVWALVEILTVKTDGNGDRMT